MVELIKVDRKVVNKADLQFGCMQSFVRIKNVEGIKHEVAACEMTKKECPYANHFQKDGRLTIFRIENCEYAIEFWVEKHRGD